LFDAGRPNGVTQDIRPERVSPALTSRNPGEDAIDGLKMDQQGNVYVSGPGGLRILLPTGTHLGTIVGPEHPHNFAWGEADGKTLYLTAQTGLYWIRLGIPGTRPAVPTN